MCDIFIDLGKITVILRPISLYPIHLIKIISITCNDCYKIIVCV